MKRRVALIVETSSGYGTSLLSGIVKFMRMHDEWSVFLEQRDLTKKPPSWLSNWSGDGIISRATTPKLTEWVIETGVPMVELTDRHNASKFPHVRSDDATIGKMAAEHLLDRGFQHFGFCGFSAEAWSKRRQAAFVETILNADRVCNVYNSAWYGPSALAWEDEQRRLEKWIEEFNKPLGLMACNDVRGHHVLEACSRLELAVPEEVAVIGVDNDELLCRVCDPPLSSVIPNATGIGFRAAELLTGLMEGVALSEEKIQVAPLGITTRQSTDVVAIDDPKIAASLRYIRENACRGINIEQVCRSIPVSRSMLERKTRKYLGRTPQQEIRRVQINRAQELLSTTDLTTEHIAKLCGFEHPEYMLVVFKRITGKTPGSYRKEAQQ
ncbi:MAG: DNA-binding transcriptional regulator [Planctomycetota bacterium]